MNKVEYQIENGKVLISAEIDAFPYSESLFQLNRCITMQSTKI